MSLKAEFSVLIAEYAKGIDKKQEIKGLLAQVEREIIPMDNQSRQNYIKDLTAVTRRVEVSSNGEYWNFISEFTLWVYDWMTESAVKKEDCSKCNPETIEL